MLGAHYRLDGVVTLVDAANAVTQLEHSPESERQIALADRIFVTKTDLVDAASLAAVDAAVRRINGRADIRRCTLGDLHPRELIGIGLASARAGQDTLRFLGELPSRDDTDGAEPAYLGQRLPARHDPSVASLSLRFDAPFGWPAFSAAMEMLIGLRGKDLLRVKGIVNVDGRPVVIQGVGHVFHPPVTLDRWPSDDHDSRLVLIARALDAPSTRALFEAARTLNAPASGGA